jgi:hypothetical protein
LRNITGEFLDSYLGDDRARRISRRYLPSREAIVEILESVLDLMYPGYFGRRDLNRENLDAHVAEAVAQLKPKLESEMEHCLCYGREREEGPLATGACAPRAHELAEIFLNRLPQIRGLLIRDVQAAFEQQRHDVGDLDHRVDGRAGGVLVGIADGVAGHRRLVGVGALAAVMAVLDVLLGVVPGAAARGHRDGDEQAGHDHAEQHGAERGEGRRPAGDRR